MTENATTIRTGLPPGAADALAAALEPRLRVHHDTPGLSPADLFEVAGKGELLDALWDAGMLAAPGGAPRPPLYREPAGLPAREEVRDHVADALEPLLRAAAREHAGAGDAWPQQASARDLVLDTGVDELVDALYLAGLLTFENVDDRAHLRSLWAAMGAALNSLAQGEDLTADLLARIPKSHVVYLLGQQTLRQQLRDAWGRIEGAKTLLATIRDRHDGDLGYLRTNLAVLQGLLAGRVHWSLTEPRDAGEPADGSPYDEVRHRAARIAVDSERLFAAAGDALIAGRVGRHPDATATLTVHHLFALRAATYGWGVAALLGYVRDQCGAEAADDAAAIVDMIMIGQHGDLPYVEDLPRPAVDPGGYAELLAGWAAAGGPPSPRPTRTEWETAGGVAVEMDTLEALALDLWRRGDWGAATAAITGPLRELLADAADRAIDRYNAGVQAAGYTGMRPVDRWWKTSGAAPPGERAVRFLAGPCHGDQRTEPLCVLPAHAMPHTAPDGTVRWTFAAADAWHESRERYIPGGYDDAGRLLMVWRRPTDLEVADAADRRADRDRDLAEEIALDEAAAAAGEDGPA